MRSHNFRWAWQPRPRSSAIENKIIAPSGIWHTRTHARSYKACSKHVIFRKLARNATPPSPPILCLPHLADSSLPSVRAVTLSKSPLSTAMSKLPEGKSRASRASEHLKSQLGYCARMLSITPWNPQSAPHGGGREEGSGVSGGRERPGHLETLVYLTCFTLVT